MKILEHKDSEVATSLSRVFTHVKQDLFCCITAFRGDVLPPLDISDEVTPEQYKKLVHRRDITALDLNRKRNKILFQKLKNLGYGYTKIVGKYKERIWFDGKVHPYEEQGIENKDFFYLEVSEESCMVIPQKTVDQELFIKQMRGLMTINGLTQDAILVKPRESDTAYEVSKHGAIKKYGAWHPNVVGNFMSATKKGRNSDKLGTFKFEELNAG